MTLFRLFLVLFIAIPLLEIYVLIRVGDVIGAWPTVLLVVFTAVLGVALLRWQGMTTLMRFQSELAQGALPAMPLFEGMLLLIAGALLLTPGFFTDSIGFVLLIPPARRALIRFALQRGILRTAPRHGNPQHTPGQRTIEGEYERRDD